MSMGRRKPKQPELWLPHNEVARSPGHRFYQKLNELLAEAKFDEQVEALCAKHYRADGEAGRPSIPPGVYFRMLLVGYFEGIESERGLEWRCSDSLSLRDFLGLAPTERVPDHSSLSRIRHRLDGSVYQAVFALVLGVVERKGLLKGRVLGVDSTYLRADASMKHIVRKDTGESYQEFIKNLAKEDGIAEPTAEDCLRVDRARKGKRTSNEEWASANDPDARIARLKDGRTRMAYKSEHVVDLETGAIASAEMFHANESDTATLLPSLQGAKARIEAARPTKDAPKDDEPTDPPSAPSESQPPVAASESGAPGTSGPAKLEASDPVEVVADKGYHKAQLLADLKESGFRTFIPERRLKGERHWPGPESRAAMLAFHQNRARVRRAKSKRYMRKRGELIERTFAHVCETGAGRRTRLRGLDNVRKQYLIRAAAANLALVMRTAFGVGTPRAAAAAGLAFRAAFFVWLLLLRFLRRSSSLDVQQAAGRLVPALEWGTWSRLFAYGRA